MKHNIEEHLEAIVMTFVEEQRIVDGEIQPIPYEQAKRTDDLGVPLFHLLFLYD
jgi:hypothetical protein